MFSTPRRPVKRRLSFTTPRVSKRSKAAVFNSVNRRTVAGPSRRGSIYQQVKSLQRVVSGLSPELKCIDITTNATNVSSSGNIQHLTTIAQGDDVSGRLGNSINIKSLYLQMSFTMGSETNVNVSYRYMIVRDCQQVADTTPNIGNDVLTTPNPLICLPKTENRERFKFLYISKPITYQEISSGYSSPNFTFNWKGNLKVSYNGTTSNDIEKNGLYLIILTDSGSATADWVGQLRIMYTDD